MPYFDPDGSLTSSERPYDTQLPRRPRPARTASSSYDDSSTPRRNSRRRDSYGGSRHHRDDVNVRHTRDADRDERRRHRRSRDPEREARRAKREERAARDPEYAARRQQRRAAKRVERRGSRYNEQRQTQDHYPHPISPQLEKEDAFSSGDDEHAFAPELQTPFPEPSLQRLPSRHVARGDSWQSSGDDWTVDLETSSFDEKRKYRSGASAFNEVDYYRRYSRPDDRDHYSRRRERQYCCGFGRRCCLISTILATLIILIIIIAVAVTVSRDKFSYTPSTAQVNATAAFASGAATRNNVNDTQDGIGAGIDQYTYYKGNASTFLAQVPISRWVSFEDMWNSNLATIQQACGWLHYGTNDSPEEIQDIYNAIQDRANASLVDHRLILAFILQESKGCVRTPNTESSGGVKNTGLMQAHHGHEYTAKHMSQSILYMVQDGVQGTKNGNGIVQELNAYYGNPYAAARAYNSGYIPGSGDLSEAAGATACYVSDIANRLTGWVQAASSCSETGDG